MPRLPSFYLWKNRYFVTESGGQGIHILCNKEDGEKEATSKLADWVKKNKKEKDDAKRAGLVDIDSPYTVAQLAAEFLQFKEVTKKASTFEFYRKSLQKFVRWYGNLQARKLCFSHGTDFISKLQAAKLGNISIN